MYRIGDFSKLTQVTIKALRYYETEGLLDPEYVDNDSGYRYYSSKQALRVQTIISLRQIGLSIANIKKVLEGVEITPILEIRKSELEKELIDTEEMLTRINNLLKRRDSEMDYKVVIKEIPKYNVYYKQGILKGGFSELQSFILSAGEEAGKNNPNIKCIDYCYVTYLDGEYREENIKVEYCEAVEEIGVESENIKFKCSAPITAATILVNGSYDKLRDAYVSLVKWLEENDYEVTDNFREVYIDGIWNKENVEDWLTEIQAPIKKR